jgi:hypothetical protein
VSHDYYTVRPHRDEADLDLEGNGDALALHARLRSVAFLDGGRLPVHPEEVRRRARISAGLWRRAWPLVGKKWHTSDDGNSLVNDDLLIEFDRVRVFLEGRSAAGSKGNALRWAEKQGKGIALGSPGDRLAIATDRDWTGLEGNGLEGRGPEGSAPSAQAAPPISSNVRTGTPTSAEVVAYAKSKRIPAASAIAFWRHHESKGWRGLVDFRPALEKWAEEDAEKTTAPRSTTAFPKSARAIEAAELDAEADQARRNREAQARAHADREKVEELIAQGLEEKYGAASAPSA